MQAKPYFPEDYRAAYETAVKSTFGLCREFYGENLVSFVLFGSVARGTFTWESDIDLLLVVKGLPNGRYRRVMDFQENVENRMDQTFRNFFHRGIYAGLSPVLKTPEEVEQGSPLFIEMIEGSQVLFDRDNFFAGYLDRLRERLGEMGAKKVPFKGGYYWVLKPGIKLGEDIQM